MKSSSSLLKDLAREYACGSIIITNINKFCRLPSDNHMQYFTTKGAFIFPISGKAIIHFGNIAFVAEPGKMIHGCPKERIKFEVLGDEPFCHINLYYESNNKVLLDIKLEYTKKIIDILESLLALRQDNSLKSNYVTEEFLDEIFETIFSNCLHSSIKTNQQLINEVVSYIHCFYDKNITLKTLAEYSGKEPNQLSYLFYKYMKIRPIDYLIKYRLEKAIKLLKEDDYKIKDVAALVGYSDPLYFSRIFKKYVGYSPSQVKNN
ncbi:AraC family transcriptional regulator [Tissierella praeacuta]|uniref:AraC family transcriptional regulator n=1 Tax=Tissierella praeacuta TaxID=43131 RepID=UPI00289CEF14|nr:AraC family transcriptional regulator [Tissierella praeacuta]